MHRWREAEGQGGLKGGRREWWLRYGGSRGGRLGWGREGAVGKQGMRKSRHGGQFEGAATGEGAWAGLTERNWDPGRPGGAVEGNFLLVEGGSFRAWQECRGDVARLWQM